MPCSSNSKSVIKLILILILTETVLSSAPDSPFPGSIEELDSRKTNFAQDLTELINKCLQDHSNSSSYSEKIRDALSWSPLVYYSTDMLLNNFHEILPVLQLLHQLNKNHRLILSLRYTNDSRFLWSRIEDVYYDLSGNDAVFKNILIRKHLSAVVLDWRVKQCKHDNRYGYGGSDGKIFYLTSYKHNTNYYYDPDKFIPVNYLFPNHFRNFLLLHSPKCPECSTVPIGIAYTMEQVGKHLFLPVQIQETDFQILSLSFSSPLALIISPKVFQAEMSEYLETNYKFAEGNTEKTTTIYINMTKNDPLKYNRFSWVGKYSKQFLIGRLPYTENITSSFLTGLFSVKYPRIFKKNLMLWANEKKMDLIFGEAMEQDKTIQNFKEEVIVANKKYVIPYLKTYEGNMSLCAVKKSLNEAHHKHERIMVNMDAWRAVARFSSKLDGSDKDHNCDYHRAEATFQMALIDFPKDTWKIWPSMENSFYRLIRDHPTVARMRLNTLIFSHLDLKRPNSTIIKFLEKNFMTSSIHTSQMNYWIGCSMFYDDVRQVYKRTMNENENATTILINTMKDSCGGKVFDFAKVIVWQIQYLRISLPDPGIEEVFLLRKLFLQEFSEKEVIVQVMHKNEEHPVIAEIYEAPIVLSGVEMK